jgi:hypothetical protein
VDQVVGAVTNVLMLPLALAHLILADPRIQLGLCVVAVVGIAIAWRYQRCPHCRGMVLRAGVVWRRCSRCGRQYHRGLRRVA